MRKFKEYDNRKRRTAMKQKRIRQVFERRNNVTRYEIILESKLEELTDNFWEEGDFEKYSRGIERIAKIKAILEGRG